MACQQTCTVNCKGDKTSLINGLKVEILFECEIKLLVMGSEGNWSIVFLFASGNMKIQEEQT